MILENWHNLSFEEVAEILKTDINKGLNAEEVLLRQRKFGKNLLPHEKPLSFLRIFLKQFNSPLVYILVIAGVVTLFLKEYTDSVVIFSAVFLNTIVGFLQENKASQTLNELKKLVKHAAEVLREGNFKIIDSIELVPGDVIILNAGDKVPADGRIIESHNLKINEMVLTGEWLSSEKNPQVLAKNTSLADRENMVYMGCLVEEGKGIAVVTQTGIETEIGKVATMVKETKEEETPYQKKLSHFSKLIGVIIGIICFVIFVEGMITGGEFIEMFTTAVAVAVAAIPEGLPIAMTVILALGMQRILKKQGLVRRLASAETLGSTSIIATDKTATLTEGRMKVNDVTGDKFLTLRAAVITSEAFVENPDDPLEKMIFRGRPTDRALLEAGIKAGIDIKKIIKENKVAEIPFDSKNKLSAVLYKEDEDKILYVYGAPEKILSISLLDNTEKEKLEKDLENFAKKGLRIISVACKKVKNRPINDLRAEIKNLDFLGFITLKDPIRKEVKEAIKTCQEAGLRLIIVTGDHKLTAKAVAEELNFKIADENILEGSDLDKLSNRDFSKILDKIQIYARVEPRHKLRIIDAWQDRGRVVAMTGDGINDAPALKKADIGVALSSGTEVAKEASDLILLNDSFSIIVAAVEEGRTIIDNIRKVITYSLSGSFTEVILVGVSILAGFPLPVTAIQILWVNLIEDGLPNIALSFEPKEKDIMKQKPTGHRTPLLTREMRVLIFIIGIVTDLILLGLLFWLLRTNYSIEYLRTMVFAMLAIDSIFFVFSCKSLRKNIWRINLFDNRLLLLGWLLGVTALLAAIYLPIFNVFLETVPLCLSAWSVILGLGLTNIALIELVKYYFIIRKKTDF